MKFDFTKGKTAKYLVSIYMPCGCNDQLYYHYYKEAKEKFKTLCNCGHYDAGTRFGLYDMTKDVRKDYAKI